MNNEHSNLNLDCMANMSSEENELFDQSETIGNVDNVTETKKTDNVHIPVPSSVEGTGKPKPVVIKIPEIAPYAAMQATGASTPQIMMPCLPSSLSAQTLFDLALTVEAPDPARQRFGFFYEKHLKYECELLIPHPIPSYYRRGIWNALMIRRRNPDFFMCYAIDVVLTHYFNNYYPEDNDVFS